jgi:hypothetical protein
VGLEPRLSPSTVSDDQQKQHQQLEARYRYSLNQIPTNSCGHWIVPAAEAQPAEQPMDQAQRDSVVAVTGFRLVGQGQPRRSTAPSTTQNNAAQLSTLPNCEHLTITTTKLVQSSPALHQQLRIDNHYGRMTLMCWDQQVSSYMYASGRGCSGQSIV